MTEKHLGVDLARVDTVQKHELGFRIEKSDGRIYRYMVAGAAIALGDVLQSDTAEADFPTHSVQPTSAADQTIVGCWPNENPPTGSRAAIADNSFFWMLEKGDALVKAAATVVAGAPIVTIATAGTVDDTAATAANALALAAGVGGYFVTTTSGGFARVMFT